MQKTSKKSYSEETINFYNSWNKELIVSYLKDNPRLNFAIRFCLSRIPKNAKTILDFGCGIGWSSHEFAKHNTNSTIIGIDISDALIQNASLLFERSNLAFQCQNLLSEKSSFSGQVDVITMIDVFEHLPKKERVVFYKKLNDLLSENGVLLLTCPTPEYQQFLREKHPEGLQPTDEDVSYSDLKNLAIAIGGKIHKYRKVSIWRKDDYFHCCIAKAKYENTNSIVRLESIGNRRQRVKQVFGFSLSTWQIMKTYWRLTKRLF